ncbi:MAG: ParA family protein [Verrucomicrobiae bacterium]|nr:ParA family protein [Verrucomicrobiae bacterium]
MSTYALWNNKGGVGKSYLTFQIAAEYARTHPDKNVLVIDVCPQANSSSMLLGGMERGEAALDECALSSPRKTIAGYIRDRVASPYQDPRSGASYVMRVADRNPSIPENLFLVPGDEELEILASRVSSATYPGADDAWARVHLWLTDLIKDVARSWNETSPTVFIDCNPSFGIYTELAMSSADRLIIPFSSDGSSKRAVRAGGCRHRGRAAPITEGAAPFLRRSRERFRGPAEHAFEVDGPCRHQDGHLRQRYRQRRSGYRLSDVDRPKKLDVNTSCSWIQTAKNSTQKLRGSKKR